MNPSTSQPALRESPNPYAGKVFGWKDLGDGRMAWVFPMMFTARLGVGMTMAATLDDAWCYPSAERALQALDEWDGQGEPIGWHRHPATDRRRDPDTGQEISQ